MPNQKSYDICRRGKPSNFMIHNVDDKYVSVFSNDHIYLTLVTRQKLIKVSILCEFPMHEVFNPSDEPFGTGESGV